MLLEQKENNTFQTQRVRNQCNNNVLYGDVIRTDGKQYVPNPKYPKPIKNKKNIVYLHQLPANVFKLFPIEKDKTKVWGHRHFFCFV